MKLTRNETNYFVDDGAKRGPMTMFRVRFHPAETKLLAQCADRRLAFWNLDDDPQEVKGRKEKCVVGELVCPHEIGWVRGFDVAPDGRSLVTGGSDRTLRRWQWSGGRPDDTSSLTVEKAHDGWVESVAFAPDGRRLATAGADGIVKVWNADDLKPIASLASHAKYACDVAFSPDGKLLVSGAEDGVVIVRDANTLEEILRIEFGDANNQFGQNPKHSGVHRLAISHDSRWLAAAGGEKLELYDLAAGEVRASETLRMDVAFHPAAEVLAGGESETRVWQYEADKFAPAEKDRSGMPKPPGAIPGKAAGAIKRGEWSLGLSFSNDGKQLAVGKADGTVEFWELA
jgi:WD40 repeat protein